MTAKVSSTRGQGEAWQRALRRARALRLHHGLLLEGGRGTGKTTAAFELAQALLCETTLATDGPCGQCAPCVQVVARSHADLHVVVAADDKQDISVDQVRQLQVTLGRRAMVGRARVVVLDPIDRLTEQGQNALLKTLEEPGADTFLLLPTTRPEGVLPTVRSRVDRLRLLPLDDAQVAAELERQQVGDFSSRELVVPLAAGAVGIAVELLESGIAGVHQSLVGALERPNEMSPVARARALLEGAAGRLEADRRVRLLLWCLRRTAVQRLRGALAEGDARTYVAAGCEPWGAILETLLDAEADLDLRIGAEQVLCFALLRIREQLRLPAAAHS